MQSRPVTTRARRSDRTERHPAVCTACNESTSVPFLPSPDRPVYCGPCHQARRYRAPAPAESLMNEPVSDPQNPGDADNAVDSVFPGMALKPATRRAIARMDISEPTPIQEKSIPHLLEGRDLIGQARTGSGKTLAFAVPMVERCDPSVRRTQALVLVPTRELAIQVAEVTKALASSQRLRVTLLYGGPVVEARVHGVEERRPDRHWHPGADAGPLAPGLPRPEISTIHGAGRGRRDAG